MPSRIHFVFNECMELTIPVSTPSPIPEKTLPGKFQIQVERSEVLDRLLKTTALPVHCVAEEVNGECKTMLIEGVSNLKRYLYLSGTIVNQAYYKRNKSHPNLQDKP
jgi:hypothetical protein